MNRTSAASRRMSRVCVICPLSELSAVESRLGRRPTEEDKESGEESDTDRIA